MNLEASPKLVYKYWLNLNSHLLWCHDIPVHKGKTASGSPSGDSQYKNSGAWLVRKGWAKVEHEGRTYHANPGQWLIVKPCSRIQTFSHDAVLLSVAFDARWPDGSHLFDEGLSLVINADEVPTLEESTLPMLKAMKSISPDTWDARDQSVNIRQYFHLQKLLNDWLIVLSEILRERGIHHSGSFDIDERVMMAVRLLNAHDLSQNLNLQHLSEKACLSPTHLVRLFQKHLNVTPSQYFEKVRQEHACRRLQQPKCRIKEVSLEMGFSYLSHFSKWFKNATGKTPTEFKAQSLIKV